MNSDVRYIDSEILAAKAQIAQREKCLIDILTETLKKSLNPNIFIDRANVLLWRGRDAIQTGLKIYLTDDAAIDLGYCIEILMHRRIEDPKKSSFSSISIANEHRRRLFIGENEPECNIINITKLLNMYSKFINNKDDILKQLLEIDLKYYDEYFAAVKNLDLLEAEKLQNNKGEDVLYERFK